MKHAYFGTLLTIVLLIVTACNSVETEQVALSFIKNGAGKGTVTISPGSVECSNTCEARFNQGTQVSLSAAPEAGSTFVAWSGACSGTAACQVVMDSAKTVTATFAKEDVPDETITLNVEIDGASLGSIKSVPAGIDCGDTCSAQFKQGSSVTLTATPNEGAEFSAWGGACAGEISSSCTLAPNADQTVKATFVIIGDPIKLSVSKEGAGLGTVRSTPAGINCGATCAADFIEGTGVILTATPAASSIFVGWTGDCSGTDCTLTLDAAKTVTATFELKPELSITKEGTGSGTVTSSPAGINCGTACQQTFDPNTEVTLSAVPGDLSKFSAWGGACGSVTENSCTLTLDASKTVSATFDALEPSELATLTVQKEGAGSGNVTSNPAGINCGSTCAETYRKGTSVSLSAAPGADSVFVGWENCASATGSSCTLTLNADIAVTAIFRKADPTSPLEVFITSSSDDAEEYVSAVTGGGGFPAGTVDTGSSDLELTYDDGSGFNTNQFVGLRFMGIDLPEGATITKAVIVFTPKSDSGFVAPNLSVQAEADPATFVEDANNISGRTLTTSSVSWSPVKWTQNRITEATTTPDLSPLLQELSWTSGDIAFVISGPNTVATTRRAYSFDADTARAPKLVLTFSAGDPGPEPVETVELSLSKAGTGSGAVTSIPAGLECDADCAEATASFEKDAEIILTAAPAGNSSFASWDGACAGSTETTCALTMDAAKNVTVTFNLDAP